jgi:tyrosyl-tRNA synthetase
VFAHHKVPEDLPEPETSERYVPRVLVELGWSQSLSEARRAIAGGGIRVDGTVLDDPHHELDEGERVLRSGHRRFTRLHIGR